LQKYQILLMFLKINYKNFMKNNRKIKNSITSEFSSIINNMKFKGLNLTTSKKIVLLWIIIW